MTSETQAVPVLELTPVLPPVPQRIADELGVGVRQVDAAVQLLDEGSTVPFIARYRKEVTGGLDDAQLRTLEERLGYLRELEERRLAVLESVRQQGRLDEHLATQILSAETKARLEDVYLPYKPKRRTKAQIAREAGLEPLADALLAHPTVTPSAAAEAFVDAEKGVPDVVAALEGARAILVERFTEDADLIQALRDRVWSRGRIVSAVKEGKQEEGAKFSDYFEHTESLAQAPSHRILALFRGEREGVLDLTVDPDDDTTAELSDLEAAIAASAGIANEGRPADAWLIETVRWAWRTRVGIRIEGDVRGRLREIAEEEAVRVFAANVRDLLLAAPAGGRPTIGLDPGFRTGVKVAVVDGTGKVVDTDVIYPHTGKWDEAIHALAALARKHSAELVAIGNGTASRETDKLAAELIAKHPELGLTKVMVSEAGASVYSASAYASAELPDMDVSLRGAVSIARRLQDPLAELVKIDPKSIGVGQYQHDITEGRLSHSLDAVVEDAVNAVGVDLNTASVPLLRRVSGVSEGLAALIVEHRDANGPFRSRQALLSVPRLGPKAFEQCAGFLRIRDGEDPLDASAVHPEAYPVVRRIADATGTEIKGLIGNTQVLQGLKPTDFVDDTFGLPTVRDILAELDKPGRDPRPAFTTATFAEGVEKVEDLQRGMVLEGVVTNVAAFGAFVDIGVHQDGLVHVSQLSTTFVKDPREVVTSGDVVKVKVLDVDVARQRISLTLRLEDDKPAGEKAPRGDRGERSERGPRGPRGPRAPRPGATSGEGAPAENRPPRGGGSPGEGRGPRGGRPGEGRGPRDGKPGEGRGPRDGKPGEGRGPRDGKPGEGRGPRDGKPGDRDRGGQGGRDRNDRRDQGKPRSLPNTALADALRRAGYDVDKHG